MAYFFFLFLAIMFSWAMVVIAVVMGLEIHARLHEGDDDADG